MYTTHDETIVQSMNYRLITLLSSAATERTYQGVQVASRALVMVKFVPKPGDEALRYKQHLFTVMQSIPNSRFLSLHEYRFVGSPNGTPELMTISEWSGTVVKDDIHTHKSNRMKYSDGFLVREMKELINTLSFLQERQIVHGNITLDTIYLTNSGLKLIEPKYGFPTANSYKTDVLALGIVFLSMALLYPATSDYQRELMTSKVSGQIKAILGRMLDPNEDQRPDFLELYRDFLGIKMMLSLQSVPMATDEVEQMSDQTPPTSETCLDMRVYGESSASAHETHTEKEPRESELPDAMVLAIPEDRKGVAFPALSVEESINPPDLCNYSFDSTLVDASDSELPPPDYITNLPVAPFSESISMYPVTQVTPETCMQCGSPKPCVTELTSLLKEFEMQVALPCNPETHFFCSRKCFSRYVAEVTCQFMIDISFVRCKRCNKALEVSFIEEAVGGRRELERDMKQTLTTVTKCEYCCQINIPVKKLSCGHDYCLDCIQMWTEEHKSESTCKVCQSVIPKTELAKYRKSALESILSAVKFW